MSAAGPGPVPLKRALTPALNPAGLGSAAAAVYAAVVMAWNVTHHHAAVDPQVIIAALGAAAFLYTRFKVTPVGDPRDGNGAPLAALPASPAAPTGYPGMPAPAAVPPPEPPAGPGGPSG